jgi:hypothetical protein
MAEACAPGPHRAADPEWRRGWQGRRAIPVLPVDDVEGCARWYRKVLGFETLYLHYSTQ